MKGALEFFRHEAAGGLVLVAMAALALVLANSGLSWLYAGFLDLPVTVRIGPLALDKPLLLWINDGLMAVFFFLVGLEIKREVLAGELATLERAMLPLLAAIGGMAAPALVYTAVNAGDAAAMRGWAIPAATDIAFAVGVLALLGSRVPPALKVFLLALAIIDDLGAIIVIALFYTADLSAAALILAAVGIAALAVLNWRGVESLAPYVLVGIFIWVCVLKSGVHATLAGVVVALAVPLAGRHGDSRRSPLERAEHGLHPWVAFGVLPLFAFANAGVSLEGLTFDRLATGIPLGIAAGLFFGKQIGVLGAVWLATRSGLTRLADGVSLLQIYGVALLAGIGFTMSLFIGTLAFPDPAAAQDVRIGVLTGSLLSALTGFLVLRYATAPDAALAVTARK
ncbi:MAG: Na+/H+ antiporter NhaA [Hyphomicrobiaceae bacterium]